MDIKNKNISSLIDYFCSKYSNNEYINPCEKDLPKISYKALHQFDNFDFAKTFIPF